MKIKYITFQQTIVSLIALSEAGVIKEKDLESYLDRLLLIPVKPEVLMIGYKDDPDSFRHLREAYLKDGLIALKEDY